VAVSFTVKFPPPLRGTRVSPRLHTETRIHTSSFLLALLSNCQSQPPEGQLLKSSSSSDLSLLNSIRSYYPTTQLNTSPQTAVSSPHHLDSYTTMLILKPFLLLISTASALSQPAIIQKVQITTLTSQLLAQPVCEPKCAIAHQYLAGVRTMNYPSIIYAVLTSHRKSEPNYPGFGGR
jgi:hypothetical protein